MYTTLFGWLLDMELSYFLRRDYDRKWTSECPEKRNLLISYAFNICNSM